MRIAGVVFELSLQRRDVRSRKWIYAAVWSAVASVTQGKGEVLPPEWVLGQKLAVADHDERFLRTRRGDAEPLSIEEQTNAFLHIAVDEALARADSGEDRDAVLGALEDFDMADVDLAQVLGTKSQAQSPYLLTEWRDDCDLLRRDDGRAARQSWRTSDHTCQALNQCDDFVRLPRVCESTAISNLP